ncbi:MAG: hypothetical protein IJE01_01525 [Clostridia bacterium]|nr:hypothetical protein [Clostridia bacterium]
MSNTFDEDYLNYNSKFQKNAEQQHKVYADKNNAAGTAYVNDMNTVIDANTQRATEKIEGQISALPQHYQSGYESNAIQQKINERQLAERMANMGLTNSGLNRTQQTAINIQRSNADAAITRQKNAAMASLRSQIADVIANANSEKNTLAAQSKYDTATRNNEMYASFMNQADQRAYDRAVTLDNQRFSAAEAEKDRQNTANTPTLITIDGKDVDGTNKVNGYESFYEKYSEPRFGEDVGVLFSGTQLDNFKKQVGMNRSKEGQLSYITDALTEGKITETQYYALLQEFEII